MFGIQAFNVVIGLIFIYLLFSLFISIVNEIISNLFNARGNNLFDAMKELIGEKGVEAFYDDPRIKVLTRTGSVISTAKTEFEDLKNKRLPSYIPDKTFGEIISEIDNSKLDGFIGSLEDSVKNSKEKMTDLFELSLLQTRETYKKNVRNLTLLVSLLVTVSFNVDSIKIFQELANDPETAALIADRAEAYIATHDSLTQATDSTITALKMELNQLYKSQIEDLNSTLGLGWDKSEPHYGFKWHSVPGWIITILALSLGAPFWFDILRKAINIKNELTKK